MPAPRESFPRDRAAAARAAATDAAARAAADAVAISTRYRGLDGPGSIGGDFYAHCDTEYGIRVIIGDVRGKGAAAVRKACFLANAFLVIAAERPDLQSVSRALDHLAAADAAGEWDAAAREWFATAVLLEIDRQGHRITVLNHGHPAPVVIDAAAKAGAAGAVRELVPGRRRLPLGLGELAEVELMAVESSADTVELGADATLLLFTDGVSEARDRAGRMFDPVAWLMANAAATVGAAAEPAADDPPDLAGPAGPDDLADHVGPADLARPADPAVLLDSLLVEVERYNGGAWRDDIALVSVRRRAAPVGGALTPASESASTSVPVPPPTPPSVPTQVPENRRSFMPPPMSPLMPEKHQPSVPENPRPPVTLPPAMVPSAQTSRRPVAPSRPRAPRNPSRRPGDGPFPDGTSLP
jgi:hypothetical protein